MARPVTVVSESGQEIRRYRPHDRLTVHEVLNDLNSRGYVNGDLEDSLGCGLTENFLLVEGECYTYVEKKGLSWFLWHEKLPSALSLASSAADIKRFMDGNNPIYDLGRVSAGIPLELAVDAFGLYAEAFKRSVLNAVDWHFVHDVMDMSGFCDDEKQREATFSRHLESYLKAAFPEVRFRFTCSVRGRSMPDIRIEAFIAGEWITVGLVEVKAELIGAEPCIKVMKYYGDHTKLLWQRRHWTYQSSCCPVLIIELVGPHIRVGGAARYVEKPAYQPFTPLLHIFKFLQDASHLSMLSRALASIGGTIRSLVAFYSSLNSSAAQLRGPELEWPVPIRALKQQGATVVQKSRPEDSSAMNVGRSKQLVFGVQQEGRARRLIKFSQRYGVDVHQQWAAEGFAPQFTCSTLPGGWFVIDMDFCTEEEGWLPLLALDPNMVDPGNHSANRYRLQPEAWEECKAMVVEAYKTLRRKFPLLVHGDLRKGNILYNLTSKRVAFIDFDWAGVEGRDIYPLFINMQIGWPPGVGPCKPMTAEDDLQQGITISERQCAW